MGFIIILSFILGLIVMYVLLKTNLEDDFPLLDAIKIFFIFIRPCIYLQIKGYSLRKDKLDDTLNKLSDKEKEKLIKIFPKKYKQLLINEIEKSKKKVLYNNY